jgi:hypothetical protein
MHTSVETVRRVLTQAERDDLADKILQAQDKIDEHQEELDAAKEAFKMAPKPLKSRIAFDRKLRRAGYIDEEKEVALRFDRQRGMAYFIDQETGEELGARRMRADEQTLIEFEVSHGEKTGTNE